VLYRANRTGLLLYHTEFLTRRGGFYSQFGRGGHNLMCTMMHSIHAGQCPTYSSDMVRAVAVNQMRSGLRSADTAQCIKPRCRIEIGKRVFSYAGPHSWNDLSPSLLCITDSKRFRKHLKHIILFVLPSTHCNACLDNYVSQAIQLSVILLLRLFDSLPSCGSNLGLFALLYVP